MNYTAEDVLTAHVAASTDVMARTGDTTAEELIAEMSDGLLNQTAATIAAVADYRAGKALLDGLALEYGRGRAPAASIAIQMHERHHPPTIAPIIAVTDGYIGAAQHYCAVTLRERSRP